MTSGTPTTMWWLCALLIWSRACAEHIRDLEVSEGVPVGTRIGFIGDGASQNSGPPYLIVPVGTAVETDLSIDQTTGEIKTKVPLDRETRASYSLVAIPISGDNVKVVVKVLDENDNAPTFPTSLMHIEFSENTPRDVKRTLYPAKDLDLDNFNTQRYNIVSGNTNNAFRLSSHRERDGVLYLDLQINGFLDRETTSSYSLLIEALDGGNPPLRGEMTVNITIQDVNDNPPVFNQSRYFASVPENATVGTIVLQVFATDKDTGENGQILYSINRRQSDRDNMFRIDPSTGLISVNKPLDFETKEQHELAIVAKDHGSQPLETTAFVSIKVTDVNDNQPIINVIFVSDDATPKISESAKEGDFVARISVNDPDSKAEYSNVNVTLNGGDGRFGLTTRDNIIYLMIVSMPLDRELQPNYTMQVIATDNGTPPLHASKTFDLLITDINDNAPQFEQEVYHANVMEVSDPGSSVIQVLANDKDDGNNSAVFYSLLETPDTHSSWFQIDSRSGLITTRVHVDCETDPVPQLTVLAVDNGSPPLSSSATVLVTIHDVNDNEPIFDQSFYNVTIPENEVVGRCIFKVSATDPDCGVNAVVNYTIGDGFGKLRDFEIKSGSGEICITNELDCETRNVYEFPVIASDRGGLSTTAIVKIQITDINDNRPIFYPKEYNVSLREHEPSFSTNSPVVVVAATDLDSGKFGQITYKISSGDEAGLFRIDRQSGEIFISKSEFTKSRPYHRLSISAFDGGDLKSELDAAVFISVIDSAQRPPIFEKNRYTFSVKEDARKETRVGEVSAKVNGREARGLIRYSIYSGDPYEYFAIDSYSGTISTANILDHEVKSQLLLNIQATSGDPPVYGHTQVEIIIEDINDNPPEFESTTVRISVPENVDVGVPLYAAHATDKDSAQNGVVRYKVVNKASSGGLFEVDAKSGHLTLLRHLDYELTQRHSVVISATDSGVPPLSANLTVMVEVQDFNDNPPVFERNEYSVQVSESLAVNKQILQVTAVDLDTGNNARLTYRLVPQNTRDKSNQIFGIFPNSGWLYLKENLDRETKNHFNLIVAATDNGTPSLTATAKITVDVLDANDNDPVFSKETYEFYIEENMRRGSFVGAVTAKDDDFEANAVVRYHLIPGNTSFQINTISGHITTKEPLDREIKETYDLIAEAKDQGSPPRSSRVQVKIIVTDINDNAPEIVDPQEDIVSVREGQPPGTEVVKVRATDADNGYNASITYSIIKGKDSDGYNVFSIDPLQGIIKTKVILDHEEKTIFRLAVSATDGGKPPKESVRVLRIGVLDLNDNRPTFTSSSLHFKVRENAKIGHLVGLVATSDSSDKENLISESSGGHITYTLSSCLTDQIKDAFNIDRSTGSLIVVKELDRELQSKYQLEVRALDTSFIDNPQSSSISVTIEIEDVNDNRPHWSKDPIIIHASENKPIGSSLYNFTAYDSDSGPNGMIRYSLRKQFPNVNAFTVDALTGSLNLIEKLDFESIEEYILELVATDQSTNTSERLSTSVTVKLFVDDYNDNAPTFIFPSTSTISINPSLSVGMVATHILAFDKDSKDNGKLSYTLNGKDKSFFSLGYNTGVLTLVKSLPENRKSFNIQVTAHDHGSTPKTTTMDIKLDMEGSMENPKLLNSVIKATIFEDVAIGTVVTNLASDFSQQGNFTYYLPSELSNDHFVIDKYGKVITKANLDREKKDFYSLPIYITNSNSFSSNLYDVITLHVDIQDVNDNPPKFQSGSCYRLFVPENNDEAVIHTVVAFDKDVGQNGQISYSIVNGNIGNKFIINSDNGDLTAKYLDRETVSKYQLTITARDKGNPSLWSSCNLTVIVEDQNDNEPKFDQAKYSKEIPEDVMPYTSILKVHAKDIDFGINSRIIYSLANESQWLFQIDNKTGVISTAGFFDRERQSIYNFLAIATDSSKYNSKSTKVLVTIFIEDINDNKPIFHKYPFTEKVVPYIQPGQQILTVSAKDADEGINAEIVYSIAPEHSNGKFRINPNTGILTATQSLASENGQTLYLNIIAQDKGNPAKSSTGLVEITVGEINHSDPKLIFQNPIYKVTLQENVEQFFDVVHVSAVRSDGRRQKIRYSFGSGNEENIFIINSETGMVQVRDSNKLDYELYKELKLIIEAKTESHPYLHSYCQLIVKLTDQNDNSPKFSQQEYSAIVWEENNKDSFVLQVVAFDADEGQNSKLLYHIVDGNHDNAFKIEPAFSGILKTNVALDREIRDFYRLTIIATDEGVPQMTGTAKIKINVLDVNDNHPTFPKPKTVLIDEDTALGNVLTTISANDVDLYPPLIYRFGENSDKESREMFSIDRYSGKVTLKKAMDYEMWQEFTLNIVASDSSHIAMTTLTIKINDVNDNAPMFLENYYLASMPEGSFGNLVDILRVNATDADSGQNGKIIYSINGPKMGFMIENSKGILQTNFSNPSLKNDVHLTVKASDMGNPSLSSLTSVRIQMGGENTNIFQQNKREYRLSLSENSPIGTSVLNLDSALREYKSTVYYQVVSGNSDNQFSIIPGLNTLIVSKGLDRETTSSYHLQVSIKDNDFNKNESIINIYIKIEDVNDNVPTFKQEMYKFSIPENTPIGTSIGKIVAVDADLPKTKNSEIIYEINSGNDNDCFIIESNSGIIKIDKELDYDKGYSEYKLIVKACDKGDLPLCSLISVIISLEDVNDNTPLFPISEYLEFISENEPVGTAIFTAQANDMDRGLFGLLNYTLTGVTSGDDSFKFFNVDSSTGLLSTNSIFDYEQRHRYIFLLKATDRGGLSSSVKVRVEIEGKDEFYPQFTEKTYRFVLATSINYPAGYVIGFLQATDRDKGIDGRVVYQLTTHHSYFKVNRTTGAILLKKKLNLEEAADLGKEVSLVVSASSGRQGSLTNMSVVEIALDPLADPGTNLAINRENGATEIAPDGGMSDWALGLFIALILLVITFGAVFVFLHMKNKRHKKVTKPCLNSEPANSSNNYVDPSAFDTIPIRSNPNVHSSSNQFAPPKYDEIPPYAAGHPASSASGGATTSELSGSEQSNSSGRGSAEDDGEDEEIRMINEGPITRDPDDNHSDMSVRNTQEYLARLGIVNNANTAVPQTASRLCDPRAGSSKETLHHHPSVPLDTLHIYDEETHNENDISNFYAKLNEVAGSDRASSTDERGDVVQNMDHVMALGGYAEVPTVTHQPSMNGSLSSIVHSEEELAGSYNWDYLLDWGPQYQPLAHVFSEIARLKDDTASVKSAASGNSSVKSKNSSALSKSVPPPLITGVAPRAIAMPLLNSRNSSHNQMLMLPRSPINHDSPGGFSTSTAISPSFSPSLSPLATKSPSVSPLVTPGLPTAHHVMTRNSNRKTLMDTEMRI